MKKLKLTSKTNKNKQTDIEIISKGHTPQEIVKILQRIIIEITDDIRNNKITTPCTKK